MNKEEARIRLEKLNESISSHEKCIAKKVREIIKLEAIINKKDDWRDGVYPLPPEQNQIIINKMQLMQEMHAFAHVRNEGWVPDWKSLSQPKWGLIYGSFVCLYPDNKYTSNNFIFGVAVKSKEIAEEMLEEFRERISEVYIKQY